MILQIKEYVQSSQSQCGGVERTRLACYLPMCLINHYPSPPLADPRKGMFYQNIGKAYALAQEHGVRLTISGLAGLGFQPTSACIAADMRIVINSLIQCFYPDIMHVFPGGVWKRVLEWCLTGELGRSAVPQGHAREACRHIPDYVGMCEALDWDTSHLDNTSQVINICVVC